jgi:16S rRNA (guanine527-N7)-methyltransferase
MTEQEVRDREILAAGSRELGAQLADRQIDDLLIFLDQVYVWNKLAGLTTIPREKAARLHLLDSLAARDFVGLGTSLDLGTGAGLPGLVLAIVQPDTQFVLVESNRKRCSFLSETAGRLGLKNVDVVQSDVRQLSRANRYPVVMSRAFRPPREFLRIARDFVRDDGTVVLLLADPTDSDLANLGHEAGFTTSGVRRLTLPGGHEARTIAGFRPVH